MLKESQKRYEIYEYIRDNQEITGKMSNTKKIIIELMENNGNMQKYCMKKIQEEKKEIEEAIEGKHFHKNMTKREILVNEISQYIYWETLIAISKNVSYKEFSEEEKIAKILNKVDLGKIGEKEEITIKEIIVHDLKQLERKEYLKGVM